MEEREGTHQKNWEKWLALRICIFQSFIMAWHHIASGPGAFWFKGGWSHCHHPLKRP